MSIRRSPSAPPIARASASATLERTGAPEDHGHDPTGMGTKSGIPKTLLHFFLTARTRTPGLLRRMALGGALGLLTACTASPATDNLSANPSTTASKGAHAQVQPRFAETPDSTSPPEAQAATTAVRFATAWAQPQLPADRWRSGIAPWCTPRFNTLLGNTDQSLIPAKRITGPPQQLDRKRGLLTYALPTDAGVLTVSLIAQDGTWKVAGKTFRPRDPNSLNQPQPAPAHRD